MQKIFDVDNKEDMDLLWAILPTGIIKVCKNAKVNTFWSELFYQNIPSEFININWHDKTEITRPVNYEDMIGCVVYFYNEPEYKSLGILKRETDGRTFFDELGGIWDYIEPVKKSELRFYGEQDD